jgi:hypothetical protein
MDVTDFVASTIEQVMQAVADTQELGRELGGYVNPTAHRLVTETPRHIGLTANGQAIFAIEFDLAVTVGAETKGEGGGRLQVASLVTIGGQAGQIDKSESTSRVRFAVPVTLPVDADSTSEREERVARQAEAVRKAGEARAQRNSESVLRSRSLLASGSW